MNQRRNLFAALAAPFEHDKVRLLPQSGRQLPYVTARTVMNHLDEVLGPANWWVTTSLWSARSFARLTIRLPGGTTLTNYDAGG